MVLLIFMGIQLRTLAQNGYLLPGARASALGTASVTLSDVWGVIHNQAGLGNVRQTSSGLYYENRFFVKELGLRSIVLALPIKAGTLGTSFTNFGYHGYTENKFNLAFAKAFSHNFSMGIAINSLSTRIPEEHIRFATIAGEIGIRAKPTKELTIGAHVYNPTRSKTGKNTTNYIPTILSLGLGYQVSSTLLLLAETEKDLQQNPVFKAGIEYQPVTHFFLRTGIHTNPLLTSFGFGFQVAHFHVDFSGNYHQTLGISTQLGVSYFLIKKEETDRESR